ncbi:MAG: MmcQ/YjbR family DNA-binding protein, partial [Oscillospiraceae bacterium]|nr:MmcQ/YjbR family DNA-binding protein [Oscillospiraceae bacterium]
HMNKENWIGIMLDGSADEEQIKNLLDMSYQLTMPKLKRAEKQRKKIN